VTRPHGDLPVYDRIAIGEYVPAPVVDEVLQLLGYDPGEVLSVSITPDQIVSVITREDGAGRCLHRHVIR
jgi:hypothetical protein